MGQWKEDFIRCMGINGYIWQTLPNDGPY